MEKAGGLSEQTVVCRRSSCNVPDRGNTKLSSHRGANRLPRTASKMMFEHPIGPPLGLHRKPSRVETAKRFWRVSDEGLLACEHVRVIESVCSVKSVQPVSG